MAVKSYADFHQLCCRERGLDALPTQLASQYSLEQRPYQSADNMHISLRRQAPTCSCLEPSSTSNSCIGNPIEQKLDKIRPIIARFRLPISVDPAFANVQGPAIPGQTGLRRGGQIVPDFAQRCPLRRALVDG